MDGKVVISAALNEGAMLALNDAHTVETSDLDAPALRHLLESAFYAGGVDEGGVAFLICLDQDAAYDSPNFLWFKERYARFLYVDRVITAPAARGRGYARRLYEELVTRAAQAGHDRVVCEVNLSPPNAGSLAFHTRLGFEEVGRATTGDGSKVVAYLMRSLSADAGSANGVRGPSA